MRSWKKRLLIAGRSVQLALAIVCTVIVAGCGDDGGADPELGSAKPALDLTLTNNCDLPLKVQVNKDGVWMNGGTVQCASNQLCAVQPGKYKLDQGSSGLDFFVGDLPNDATKAEVSYLDVLTYDISVISMDGCGDPNCGSSQCCKNQFNRSLKVTTVPSCRCLHCDSVQCADAYHFPHDDAKQVRCQSGSEVIIDFCPHQACAAIGFSNCTPAQQSTCFKQNDQPCTGSKDICCPQPSYGATHACYCETREDYCATAPDPSSGCGNIKNNYCRVLPE